MLKSESVKNRSDRVLKLLSFSQKTWQYEIFFHCHLAVYSLKQDTTHFLWVKPGFIIELICKLTIFKAQVAQGLHQSTHPFLHGMHLCV